VLCKQGVTGSSPVTSTRSESNRRILLVTYNAKDVIFANALIGGL
jgi:hypothetical protein